MSIISSVIGFVMGLFAMFLSKKLIHNREGFDITLKLYDNKSMLIWMLLSGAAYYAISFIFSGNLIQTIECMMVFTICLSLSAVDFEIKKIPNVLLLSLILLKVVMLIIVKENVETSIFGFFFAFVVFVFPAKFGKSIGAGDIKLAMVIGFYLGVWGFIHVMAIMGICLFFYWAYLYITRKGNLQTSVALGPYISIGFVIALCARFPLNL